MAPEEAFRNGRRSGNAEFSDEPDSEERNSAAVIASLEKNAFSKQAADANGLSGAANDEALRYAPAGRGPP